MILLQWDDVGNRTSVKLSHLLRFRVRFVLQNVGQAVPDAIGFRLPQRVPANTFGRQGNRFRSKRLPTEVNRMGFWGAWYRLGHIASGIA
jgi:hypothetical protein